MEVSPDYHRSQDGGDEPENGRALPLPAASHSRVKSATFVKSSTALDQCPPPRYPEFAVIGRSNVGKSSLINALTSQSSLAKVSKTPGAPPYPVRYHSEHMYTPVCQMSLLPQR